MSAARSGALVLPDGVSMPSGTRSSSPIQPAMQRIRRRDAIFRRTLVASDLVAFMLAFLAGPVLVGGAEPTAWVVTLPLALVAVTKAMGLYDRDRHMLAKRTLTELPGLVGLASLVTLASWLIAPVIVHGAYGRPAAATFGLSFLALLVAARTAGRENARRLTTPERCLLVGDEASVEELRQKLAASRVVKAETLAAPGAAFDNHVNGSARNGSAGVVNDPARRGAASAHASELEELIELDGIERVVLTVDLIESDAVLDAVRRLQSRGVRVSLLPRTSRVPVSAVELDQVDGVNLYGVKASEITRSSMLLKRSLDMTVAISVLMLTAPLLLVIAVAIRLESRGGVIYRQERIGRDGAPFQILKFRTMIEGAHAGRGALDALNEAGGLFKVLDDPRITRIGRLLRRTSIDELPQLVNVLRGEMSLVGPRPLVPEEDLLVTGHYRARSEVSPGMTGHWQVLGSWRVPLEEMVKLDQQYVANWSLWGDLELLLRTLGHVLHRRGA